MASHTHNLLNSKKAQFFVLSAFAIVAVIFLVSRWVEPYTIPDTSSVALGEEPFIFDNIKEKSIFAVTGSRSCEDLYYNLLEYKEFVESYASGKLMKLDFNYTATPCYEEPPLFPTVIEFRMKLTSNRMIIASNFTGLWPR